jgi:hypothetical protein
MRSRLSGFANKKKGEDYILVASAAGVLASAASEAPAEPVSVASTAASVDAGFSPVQPARAKEVPITAARMSLRMRYNPWIEVNRAGQAARRKAYSGDRLRAPINRQFIALQAFNAFYVPPLSYRVGTAGFFPPFDPCAKPV